jgi:hypothetical protein
MEIRVKENKIQARTRPQSMRDRGSRDARIYHAAGRIYVFREGKELKDYVDQRPRHPVKLYREQVIKANPGLEGHIRWSQRAGCACGCSPGFIADRTLQGDGGPSDIFLTITSDPED